MSTGGPEIGKALVLYEAGSDSISQVQQKVIPKHRKKHKKGLKSLKNKTTIRNFTI